MTAAELAELRFLIHIAIAVDESRASTCFQKHKHRSESIARKAAKNFDGAFKVYHCNSCHCWHVGGQYAVQRKSEKAA